MGVVLFNGCGLVTWTTNYDQIQHNLEYLLNCIMFVSLIILVLTIPTYCIK